MREPFIQAIGIIEELKKHGHQAYFVGGSVRDSLLQKEVDDVDITTSATPNEVVDIFPKTIPVGIEHGTVIVRHHHCSYEVTTFRAETEYEDFRRPTSVSFITSLEADLSRRDFTINAIAMTEEGEFIDPFNGQDDLRNGIIRTVGNPHERFREDPLRMMRAVRFISQLSFTLDNLTEEAITRNAHLLKHISIERIAIEFEKLLKGKSVQSGIKTMIDTGLYRYLPAFSDHKKALLALLDLDMGYLQLDREYWTLLISLLEEVESELVLRQWKRPSRLIKDVKMMLSTSKELDSYTLYRLGLDLALSVARVHAVKSGLQADEEDIINRYHMLPFHERKELAITADELIQLLNHKPGPWLKECLEMLEMFVVEGKVSNQKDQLIKVVRERFPNER